MTPTRKIGWDFGENEQIVPGLHAIDLLGGGTRAEAWVAWDDRLHTVVVVKILRPDHVEDRKSLAALAREASVLSRLQHPAIVRCFAAVLSGDRPHLVLESLDGPRLTSLLRRFGPLSPEQLVPLGVEVSAALAYMHTEGFVHLDVKPHNLIMSATPRLIDLGMVRTLAELSELLRPVGTRPYMAPEQCRAETLDALGPPADVWGLGITLYEAVSGLQPFKLRDGRRYPQLDDRPPPLPTKVPAALARLIMQCLAYEPEERPTAAHVRRELEPLFAESRRRVRRRLRARRR